MQTVSILKTLCQYQGVYPSNGAELGLCYLPAPVSAISQPVVRLAGEL